MTVITSKVRLRQMFWCEVNRGGRKACASGNTRREATKRALRLWEFKYRRYPWAS